MAFFHEYDWIFAIGVIFASLDAYNIGANDVANSFATSVASKSLTLPQACVAAAIFEFLGAVLVGARVSSTIKNGIIASFTAFRVFLATSNHKGDAQPVEIFEGNAGVQMLAFACALVGSATWLMIATRKSWPVSTTYSIVSALAGVGVATGGANSVSWGWNGGKGMATIFAGFGIAPALAAAFASIIFLITKYGVLVRKNSTKIGLMAAPMYFFTVTAILTMSIVYKGAPSLNLDKLSEATVAAAIVGTASVIATLSVIFWLPFVYCRIIRNDYTVRFYHIFLGPLLWRREPPADAGTIGASSAVPDYRIVKDDAHQPIGAPQVDGSAQTPAAVRATDAKPSEKGGSDDGSSEEANIGRPHPSALSKELEKKGPMMEGPWIKPQNLWILARYTAYPFVKKALTHGTTIDIHELQAGEHGSKEAERMRRMHAHASQYDNKTEHLYSFLQVMTACTASFAHGSNDVANAVGPFSAIYQIWRTSQPVGASSDVPVWILAFGGVWIVIGLATYGYNIMKVLGNKLTLHSPSRGFSMELGASVTVLLASQYGIPVSSTMCITGATLGVAICNGDIKAFNWPVLGWIVLGWVLTVPIVSVLSGCLMGMLLNAPSF